MLVVVYVGIGGDNGNSCTWEGAVGCGAGEAPLPSRIESDKSKSGICNGHMGRVGRGWSRASSGTEAFISTEVGASLITCQSKP